MSFSAQPRVFWITGLPGTGKSTLAGWLYSHLQGKGVSAVWLDGDNLRNALFPEFGYLTSERRELALRYHNLTSLIFSCHVTVIVSTVSMFNDIQKLNREKFLNYSEIYLDVNSEFLVNGPRKSQYSSENMDLSPSACVENPLNPDLHLKAINEKDRLNWISELEVYLDAIE